MLEPFLKDLGIVASEGFIEIRLFKIGCAAGHVQHHIAAVFGKVGDLVHGDRSAIRRHIDVIPHEGRLVLHPLKKAEGFVQELTHSLARQPQRIDELVVGVRHPAVHQGSIVVCLDNAEDRGILTFVERIEPTLECLFKGHVLRHEFEILHAALGNDQLDILDASCRGIASELADAGDAVVLKPLLEVGIKGAGLEEAIAEEHHALVGVIKLLKYTGIEKCFTVQIFASISSSAGQNP